MMRETCLTYAIKRSLSTGDQLIICKCRRHNFFFYHALAYDGDVYREWISHRILPARVGRFASVLFFFRALIPFHGYVHVCNDIDVEKVYSSPLWALIWFPIFLLEYILTFFMR